MRGLVFNAPCAPTASRNAATEMDIMKAPTTLACIAIVAGLGSVAALADGNTFHVKRHAPRPVRFAVFSDPHYYNAALGTTGDAFEAYLGQDRKMLRESEAILDSALESVLAAKVDFVLVPGDLTKDGELVNHLGFARRLARLERAGIQTFVVPGNHDIHNPHAVAYRGNNTVPVRSVSPALFAAIYRGSGYAQALDRDRHSLSYVAEPVRGLWLLALDSADYDDNHALGHPVTAGRLKPETQAWALAKLAQAERRGKQVIAMLHHGMLEHFTGQSLLFGDYVLQDWPTVSRLLGNAGLKTVFTGHFHAQDVTTQSWEQDGETRTITDVETGSLVTAPCPIRIVTLECDGALSIESQYVQSIDYDLPEGDSFPDYAREYLYQGLVGITRLQLEFEFGVPADEAAFLAPHIARGFVAHYAGDEAPSPQDLGLIQSLKSNPASVQLGYYVEWIWTDLAPADNAVVLGL